MYKVTFKFEDGSLVEAFAAEGENLLEVARKTNVAIDAPCSGNAACGKCRVQLLSGELEAEKTAHITEEEYAQGPTLVPECKSREKSRQTCVLSENKATP